MQRILPRLRPSLWSILVTSLAFASTSLLHAQDSHGDTEALRLIHVAEIDDAGLVQLVKSSEESESLRRAGLRRLIQQEPDAAHTISLELAGAPDTPALLRMDARSYLLGRNADIAIDLYIQALSDGILIEQQEAVDVLAAQEHDKARRAIAALSLELAQERIEPGLVLEVYEAVIASGDSGIRKRATDYADRRSPTGTNQILRDTVMLGGDIDRGRSVFIGSVADCQRCHSAGLEDTGTVGPPLGSIALQRNPAQNLQSLLNPNEDFAPGYQPVSLTLNTGVIKTGRILSQTPNHTTLIDSEGNESTFSADTIVSSVASAVSPMPAMSDRLSAREIRDVMAYLATLDTPPADGSGRNAAGGHASQGPTIANAFADINHGVVLPIILMGLCLFFGALLLCTVWLNGSAS